MADQVVWTGTSGQQYTYFIFNNPPQFNPNQDGNYIYAKVVNKSWVPVYIGEGCLSDRCCDNHHKAEAIRRKGATHVHAHLSGNSLARRVEEMDLLARYVNAYEPAGCNEKLGG